VDIRFVCATNRDPLVEVEEGRFREDLYYRLNVVPIELPSLKERDDDVMMIADKLLDAFNTEMGKQFTEFSEAASTLMLAYNWPGNVRELQNVVENMVIMNTGTEILPDMLPEGIQNRSGSYPVPTVNEANQKTEQSLEPEEAGSTPFNGANSADSASAPASIDDIKPLWQTEKHNIEEAIRLCNDNVPLAAARLGVSPSTLYRKIKGWDKEAETD